MALLGIYPYSFKCAPEGSSGLGKEGLTTTMHLFVSRISQSVALVLGMISDASATTSLAYAY